MNEENNEQLFLLDDDDELLLEDEENEEMDMDYEGIEDDLFDDPYTYLAIL